MVTGRDKSDFQILAQFAERSAAAALAHGGGGAAELAAEGVGEVAVAGKAEVEGQRSQVVRAAGQSFERGAEAQPGQVAMDRHAGSLLKDAGEMKGRRVYGPGDVIERDAFTQPAREVGLGRLGAVGVGSLGAVTAAPARQAVARERRFEHVGEELERRYVSPERFERLG